MNSVNACCELELAKTLSSSIINEQHNAAKKPVLSHRFYI